MQPELTVKAGPEELRGLLLKFWAEDAGLELLRWSCRIRRELADVWAQVAGVVVAVNRPTKEGGDLDVAERNRQSSVGLLAGQQPKLAGKF